jgi:hypothetical protein
MNRATRYALGLLVEEMGEALCHIGRALRFGLQTVGQDGRTEQEGLNRELGDVVAAIDYADRGKVVADWSKISFHRLPKRLKLLDPTSTDNMGRRLAPDPSEAALPSGE